MKCIEVKNADRSSRFVSFIGNYSVSQNSPEVFWHFLPNGWEFLSKFYKPITQSYLLYRQQFLFNYFQLWQSYAILSATIPAADGGHFEHNNVNWVVALNVA